MQTKHVELFSVCLLDEGAIPSTSKYRGKLDDCRYNIESYLYVNGKLVRIKTPDEINAVALK